MLLLFLFLSNFAYADNRYNEAIKTATIAAVKQSGLEADFLKVNSTRNKKAANWARENGLDIPLTVATFVVPVVYKKQIRFKTDNVSIDIRSTKLSAEWRIEF